MNIPNLLEKTKSILWETSVILGLVLAVSVLVSTLFGPDVPFFGGVLNNVQGVVEALGSEGLGLIIAIIIILSVWNRKTDT
ncbi:MAG: hypothetical protein P8P22_03880 [Porticoccaceae bacterium]|jgi:hypothetical protein|nr:hypothetical protein [Porticoccaceae bacterium]MDG1307266.1 hypothetical protein [Porticoccaceae bacterium]